MPFPPTCTRGRAEVKQAAPPTVTARCKDAGKCDRSIKSSINKGTSEHCLETRLLPLFPGARTWLEPIANILLNHAGRWIRLFLPKCRRSWNPFPGRGVSSGGNPRNKLGMHRFWLGLTKATLQKKRLARKDVLNIASICLSAEKRKNKLKTILEIDGKLGLEESLLTSKGT